MNTVTEKSNQLSEASKKIGDAHDLLIKAAKLASLLGSLCGFIYFWAFTAEIGIPFPLELNTLPTTLLIVGVISVAGTLIVIGGIFVPGLAANDSRRTSNGYFLARDSKGDIQYTRLFRYFKCIWVPMAAALWALVLGLGVITDGIKAQITTGVLLLFSIVWIFLTPWFVDALKEKKWPYITITLIHTLLAVWAYSLTIMVTLIIVPEIDDLPAWVGCLALFALFSLLHMAVWVPTDKGRGGVIVLPPHFEYETTPAVAIAIVLACILTAMTVVMPPANSKIGRAVLKAFRVGGGIPVTLCLKTVPPAQIAQRFNFDADNCSETVLMQLDSGDKVYVSKFIPEQKSAKPTSTLAVEAVYFRQDEIRQKIYLRLAKKEPIHQK
ncbi:hypothetical protein RugamoR64_45640 [Duganella rhizosphaerae]|uniref:hypothetical protein n=1 Tax=Duganella rhizosphaerae TaxID=2885763 RepID=UPI0030E7F1D1